MSSCFFLLIGLSRLAQSFSLLFFVCEEARGRKSNSWKGVREEASMIFVKTAITDAWMQSEKSSFPTSPFFLLFPPPSCPLSLRFSCKRHFRVQYPEHRRSVKTWKRSRVPIVHNLQYDRSHWLRIYRFPQFRSSLLATQAEREGKERKTKTQTLLSSFFLFSVSARPGRQ